MPESHGVADLLHYTNRRDYTSRKGNVSYLDSTPLARPTSMPIAQRLILLVIVVIAIIIGYFLVNTFVISRWQAAEASEQAIANNLKRPASIETIPNVPSLVTLDDASLKEAFANAGYTMYDATALNESYDLMLYRVPDDVTLDEAAADFQKGIGSLSAEEASKLLVGGWLFAADRVNGTSMVTRYADFSTGDPQIAVQNAIIKEGLDPTSITDSGEDESGNTYSAGTIMLTEDLSCNWKVSALPLDDVYSIAGLPKDACYVGIRATISQ